MISSLIEIRHGLPRLLYSRAAGGGSGEAVNTDELSHLSQRAVSTGDCDGAGPSPVHAQNTRSNQRRNGKLFTDLGTACLLYLRFLVPRPCLCRFVWSGVVCIVGGLRSCGLCYWGSAMFVCVCV